MERKLSSEHQLTVQPQVITDFWQRHVKTGTLKAADNIRLAYAYSVPQNARGTVVISSGRIEAYLKYQEVGFDFFHHGYAVFIHDHRGQGLSSRMTENPHQGYVEHFEQYVADMETFIEQMVKVLQPKGPRYLVGHSMGCAIGVLTALKHPDYFDKLVFCSPMFGIRPALPRWLANQLLNHFTRKFTKAGLATDYFVGQKDYLPPTFENNHLTHSRIRYRLFRMLYAELPALQLGGVTIHWLRAALHAIDIIESRASELNQPCLLLSAGGDTVVDNRRQMRVAQKLKAVTVKSLPGAYHELFIEKDDIRNDTFEAIFDFLA